MAVDLVSQLVNAVRQDEPPVRATEFGTRFSMTEDERLRNRADMAASLDTNDAERADSIRRAAGSNTVA